MLETLGIDIRADEPATKGFAAVAAGVAHPACHFGVRGRPHRALSQLVATGGSRLGAATWSISENAAGTVTPIARISASRTIAPFTSDSGALRSARRSVTVFTTSKERIIDGCTSASIAALLRYAGFSQHQHRQVNTQPDAPHAVEYISALRSADEFQNVVMFHCTRQARL